MVTVGRTAAYLFGDFTKRVDQHIFWKLLTQLLARNTFVALAVAMLATKSLITFFNTRCHSIAGAVPDEWLLLYRLGEAVAQEAQPVCQCPSISRKQKTQALSSVSVPAPTQKRRKSQAQESHVMQVPQLSRLFGGPRAAAQSCHQNIAVHRLQQVSPVCLARASQSAVRDDRWLRQSLLVLL